MACLPGDRPGSSVAGQEVTQKGAFMLPLILVLLLVLLLFGFGFAVKALWIVAGVLLVVWLLGFVMRRPVGGGTGRWYRW